MATVIAVYNSEGCVGRCDAHCHDAAPGTPCDCICGGMNHAAGASKAIDNTREMCDAWLKEYKIRVPDIEEVEVPILYTTQTTAARRIARHINKMYGGDNAVKNIERVTTPVQQVVRKKVVVDGQAKRVLQQVTRNKHMWRVTLDNGAVIERPTSKAIDLLYNNPIHKGQPALQMALIA